MCKRKKQNIIEREKKKKTQSHGEIQTRDGNQRKTEVERREEGARDRETGANCGRDQSSGV